MKIKTSITISRELSTVLDEVIGSDESRSLFLEKAAWAYVAKLRRAQRNARDLEILNRRADFLNQEAQDALSYQMPL
ncbi:MAG: hypothetical protein KBG20_03085 [Caldilineaceae bacterium]|nr:hypothetical protein [Caldilineaceae bacterium]MBP8107725.1 hypothetical protein [Caldilineaceae bacterium]MBP8122856.1 hypothetical protein [Caldilineaceae bacterium]MBP9071250.1 hypothetical protein [Caldilineaceae bacterium]